MKPAEYAMPANKSETGIGVVLETPRLQPTPTITAALPGSVEGKDAMRAKYVIREIASAQLLQEEIAKTDPNLVSVASFLNSVCGNNPDRQKVREAAQVLI